MAINRRFLYAGLFLVALGGVVVAVQLSALDTGLLASALRLWPLALVAIGAGIALRRSRYALVFGVLGAMIPGLVLGGGVAVAPQYSSNCGTGGDDLGVQTDQGSLTDLATVAIDVECGELTLDTRTGSAWSLTSRTTQGRTPTIDATSSLLAVRSTGGGNWLSAGKQQLDVHLPSSRLESLGLVQSAGRSTLRLLGASISRVDVTGNAADILIDGRGASIEYIDAGLNLGRLSIELPEHGPYSGAIRVGAGEVRLCVPLFLGVHVDFSGSPREVRVNGFAASGSTWENEAYATAVDRADLSVDVHLGSVLINPIGGCES